MFRLSVVLAVVLTFLLNWCPGYALSVRPGEAKDAMGFPRYDFDYVVDGEFSKKLNIPTYEWIPRGEPRGAIIAIHGLSLHGGVMAVLGKACASYGYYFVSPDMRGFGRAFYDPNNKFNKKKVDYKGSVDDLIKLGKLIKQKYDHVPLGIIGESLGCSIAIHMAALEPDLPDNLVLSGPAVRINPDMIFNKSSMAVLLHPRKGLDLKDFHKYLVSNDPATIKDCLEDPLMRKQLTIPELLRTDAEVAKTAKFAKKLRKNIPILVLQAGADKCNMPTHVAKLMAKIKSPNQTVRWLDGYGHLNIETAHLRVGTIEAISSFADQLSVEAQAWIKDAKGRIQSFGGTLR